MPSDFCDNSTHCVIGGAENDSKCIRPGSVISSKGIKAAEDKPRCHACRQTKKQASASIWRKLKARRKARLKKKRMTTTGYKTKAIKATKHKHQCYPTR